MPEPTDSSRTDDRGTHGVRVPRWLDTGAGLAWRFLLVAAALWILAWLFTKLRLVFVPTIIAVFLATVLTPPTAWLRRRGFRPLPATWLVFLIALVLVGGLGFVIGPPFVGQLDELGATLDDAVASGRDWLVTGPLALSEQQIDAAIDRIREELEANMETIARGAVAGAALVVELIAGFLLALVLTFFFVKDGDRIGRWFVGLFPPGRARDLHEAGSRISGTITGYIRGVIIVGAFDAFFIGLALTILGVPLVIPIAILTFFGAFFPFVGATLAGLLATLVALVSEGFVVALIVVGVTIVVQQTEGNLLQPLIVGRALKLHPVPVILALTAGALLAGVVGAFLAVPTLASISSVVDYIRSRPAETAGA